MYERLSIVTRSQERLEDITTRVNDVLRSHEVNEGICYLFVPHTTAGIMVNENADPHLATDFLEHMRALVPASEHFRHAEGNSHAHIKAALVGHSLVIPVEDGQLTLGRWQGVFLAEFDGPQERTVVISMQSTSPIPGEEPVTRAPRRR